MENSLQSVCREPLIGKLFEKLNTLKRIYTFPALADTIEIRYIPPDIVKIMSTDQQIVISSLKSLNQERLHPSRL